MLEGVVLEVVAGGLAYVEEKGSKRRFAFTFGKIRGYRGETAQELRLRVGSPVRFSVTDERVDEVELVEASHRRGSRPQLRPSA